MPGRFPRAAAALATAGVLVAGAAIAASAHQQSGVTGFSDTSDESASAPRVEQPAPGESPEQGTLVVTITPAPEASESPDPAESPEAAETPEPAETPDTAESEDGAEHEVEARPAFARPTPAPEHDGDQSERRD